MTILGIETSCDETSIAILEASKKQAYFYIKPRAKTISSQIKIHAAYGGVVPMLASREHVKNLPIVYNKTIKQVFKTTKNTQSKIDLIAVSAGPGLIPALLIGVNFAKTLALAWHKPIIGVNHLEGHLLSFLLQQDASQYTKNDFKKIFPAIALLVSGGHTQLIYVKNINHYQVIGETVDDAAGECFDKGARILGLAYPGGPVIASEALKIKPPIGGLKITPQLPRPMLDSHNYDFSFSGLKTALLYSWQVLTPKNKRILIPALAYELQEAITDVLVDKTLKAGRRYQVKSIILGGGVTANQRLKNKFQERINQEKCSFNFYSPLLEYTTDNAMMIALAGFFNVDGKKLTESNFNWKQVEADANLRL